MPPAQLLFRHRIGDGKTHGRGQAIPHGLRQSRKLNSHLGFQFFYRTDTEHFVPIQPPELAPHPVTQTAVKINPLNTGIAFGTLLWNFYRAPCRHLLGKLGTLYPRLGDTGKTYQQNPFAQNSSLCGRNYIGF